MRQRTIGLLPFASALLAISFATTAEANLIVNGGFELPGGSGDPTLGAGSTFIPGWVVSRDTIDYIGGSPGSCGEGLRCLDLDGTVGFGGITQTLSTIPGQEYRVTFLLSGNPARYSETEPLEKYLGVSAAGSSASFLFTVTPPLEGAPTNWTLEEWIFTAAAPSTTIEFYSLDSISLGHSGFFGPALDAVGVQAVPEPSVGLLVGLGLLILALRNRT
jgi:choice-of-anchor C domain-containing protein